MVEVSIFSGLPERFVHKTIQIRTLWSQFLANYVWKITFWSQFWMNDASWLVEDAQWKLQSFFLFFINKTKLCDHVKINIHLFLSCEHVLVGYLIAYSVVCVASHKTPPKVKSKSKTSPFKHHKSCGLWHILEPVSFWYTF